MLFLLKLLVGWSGPEFEKHWYRVMITLMMEAVSTSQTSIRLHGAIFQKIFIFLISDNLILWIKPLISVKFILVYASYHPHITAAR
jgi:hypothetical protein